MRIVKRLPVSVILTAIVAMLVFSPFAFSKPKACEGISKKCGDAYDKTIKGGLYSCVKCSQALCKNGGKGGLAGTETKTTCTSKKPSTFETPARVKPELKMAPIKGTSKPQTMRMPMDNQPLGIKK